VPAAIGNTSAGFAPPRGGYGDGVPATGSRPSDALLLVDVLADFGHDDGGELFAAFRRSAPALADAIAEARAASIPVVYANDDFGTWAGDRHAVLAEARRRAPEPGVLDAVAPRDGDAFLTKPRYSAFDHTPLDLLLEERGTRRLLLAGTATEMCVAQTAIDAREAGYQATVLVRACASVNDANARLALEYIERIARARLHREGAVLPATSEGS
jgi:nicotinamidase-related amidase